MHFDKSVINMVRVNMGLKAGESVLVVNDVPNSSDWAMPYSRIEDMVGRSLMAKKVYDTLKSEFADCKVDYLAFPAVGQHGSEPPADVAERFLDCDVLLLVTTYSLSHTASRERASKKGVRIASMPGIEYSMFTADGPMSVDYSEVSRESSEIAALLSGARVARITTGHGTDITFSLDGRKGDADTGMLSGKGQWGNLPGGEAFIAPVEGTANGRLVVPKGWYLELEEDMVLTFRDGYVVSLEGGGKVGDEFTRLFAFDNEDLKHRRNCAELGIGTNPKASKPDNVLEAEKIKGTVHIAVGDSSHMGGHTESDLHEDFVLPSPTLYLDGRLVKI